MRWRVLLIVLALAASHGPAAEIHPFAGIAYIARHETSPRPVSLHVVLIDLRTPGLRFLLTPPDGQAETLKQTTLQFLTQRQAQLAVNAHFFEPWPPPSPDPGTADLVGLAASQGRVYSGFEDHPPKPQAIRPNAPALNIDPANHAAIVHRDPADPTGRSIIEPVTLHTTFCGNEQIITGGSITAGAGTWDNTPNPRTVIGLAPQERLVILVVDGRQSGSEGMGTREAADLLARDYGVVDAINLDGGGSSTLCMADPLPRAVNRPVGMNNQPGTLRPVGSNLAVFAPPAGTRVPATPVNLRWAIIGGTVLFLLLLLLAWRRSRQV